MQQAQQPPGTGPCGCEKSEQLFVFLQAAGTAKWEKGVLAARLEGMPRPDPEQLFPEFRTTALGSWTCWA